MSDLEEIQYEIDGTDGEITEMVAKQRLVESELNLIRRNLTQLYEKRNSLVNERNQIVEEMKK